jgi:hypothetical protein
MIPCSLSKKVPTSNRSTGEERSDQPVMCVSLFWSTAQPFDAASSPHRRHLVSLGKRTADARSPLRAFPEDGRHVLRVTFAAEKVKKEKPEDRSAALPNSLPIHVLLCRSSAKAQSLLSSSTRLCPGEEVKNGVELTSCFLLWELTCHSDPCFHFPTAAWVGRRCIIGHESSPLRQPHNLHYAVWKSGSRKCGLASHRLIWLGIFLTTFVSSYM